MCLHNDQIEFLSRGELFESGQIFILWSMANREAGSLPWSDFTSPWHMEDVMYGTQRSFVEKVTASSGHVTEAKGQLSKQGQAFVVACPRQSEESLRSRNNAACMYEESNAAPASERQRGGVTIAIECSSGLYVHVWLIIWLQH